MTTMRRQLLVFATTFCAASAAYGADGTDQPQSSAAAWFWGLFWMLLPIAIMVLVLVVFFKRAQKPHFERNVQHMQRQVQHMERVEQSLSRIIELLEKKG